MLLGAVMLGMVLVGYPQAAALAQAQTGENSLIRARYLVSEKMYEEALKVLENIQPSGSDRMWADLAYGEALSGLDRLEESNRRLMQVTGEAAARANYVLAENYIRLNDFSSAMEWLSKHLADKNHYPGKRIRMNPAFSKLDDNREWIRLWQTEWYSNSEKLKSEGEYLLSQGQFEEAQLTADRMESENATDSRAFYLRAEVFRARNEERNFRQAFDKSWQLAGSNVSIKNDLLQFALQSGYYEKVTEITGDLIRRDPTNPDYLLARSLVRILDGKANVVLKEIEMAQQEGFAPAELLYQAGVRISESMPQLAETYLTKAIADGKLDARYFFSRGRVRNSLGKSEDALDDMGMSLDINPNQPELYVERALIRLDAGDTEGACHDCRRAMEMGNKKAADQLYKYCRLP